MSFEFLRDHTTLRVGGQAELFYPESIDSLKTFIKNHSSYVVLGSGSNVLPPDEGIREAVIKLDKMPQDIFLEKETKTHVFIEASSSTSKQKFLAYCLRQGYSGAEFLAGIPGNIGGGIAMNAGTQLSDFSSITEKVCILTSKGEFKELDKKDVGFDYRDTELVGGDIILKGLFKLEKKNLNQIQKTVKELIRKRNETQPVTKPNCGCIFKNPIINGKRESAGKLIDQAGLKNIQIGQALISEKHANFIINVGEAKSSDILKLIFLVKEKVVEKFGVQLEEEVRIWNSDKI